jgi:phosphoglucosamine mutase
MKKLFGTDGIRGIAGEYPLTPGFIRSIGYAAASVLGEKPAGPAKNEFVLGRDTRESSLWISEEIAHGITAAGFDVIDAGVVPTPLVAYVAHKRGALAGCVISASHNPAEFNGIKFFSNNGTKIPDMDELRIEKALLEGKTGKSVPGGSHAGRVSYRDTYAVRLYESFLHLVVGKTPGFRKLKIVVDCANGADCKIAPEMFSGFGAEVTVISASPDGKNINKDCGALHLGGLAAAVTKIGADFGIAYDGDGDRCIFVDEKGTVRDGDYLIAIAADHLHKNNALKKNGVVVTVMANLGFFKAMEKAGINVFTSGVGDKYVYEEMVKNDVILGGEQSGHIIFRNHMNTGDGLLTSLLLAAIIAGSGKPLSELSGVMKKYPQVLLNVKVKKKQPVNENAKLTAAIKAAEAKLGDNGRVFVRYSGTEPLLRIMLEGPDENEIKAMSRDIASHVDF